MPRPRLMRRIRQQPGINYFKPAGVRKRDLDEVVLTLGEYEAVRLKDLEKFPQDKCSKMMDISQPTFHRLLSSARHKIADAIINSKAIRIEGGNYTLHQ